MNEVILIIAILIFMLNPAFAKPKQRRDKSYIAASSILTAGSIVLFFNPIIGGSLLVAGSTIHLIKSLKKITVNEKPTETP